MHFCYEKEKILQAYKLEGQRWWFGCYKRGKGFLIREWAEELAKPTDYNNGVAACPYALKALDKGEVKTIITHNLWPDVLQEVSTFHRSGNKVTMFFDYEYEEDYEHLEKECMALNKFFIEADIDIWLLAYLKEEAIVFVQKWSELENAAAKLEKLGYYTNYDREDYDRHILARRKRRV